MLERLKEGGLRAKKLHNVYCSRCGQLTAFRDPTGQEGNAAHISEAAVRLPKSILPEKLLEM